MKKNLPPRLKCLNTYSPAGSAVLEVVEPLGQGAWKEPLVIAHLITVTKSLTGMTSERKDQHHPQFVLLTTEIVFWNPGCPTLLRRMGVLMRVQLGSGSLCFIGQQGLRTENHMGTWVALTGFLPVVGRRQPSWDLRDELFGSVDDSGAAGRVPGHP